MYTIPKILELERYNMRNQVISLYDYTGEALKPWAEMGYECYAYDIQHSTPSKKENGITYIKADLYNADTLLDIVNRHKGKACFLSAFPPCTDLAVSGAPHFKKKLEADPNCQKFATDNAICAANVGELLDVPYYVENPVSRLSTLWRKPDYIYHPYEYGRYIALSEAEHPRYPEYIAPRDAYSKKTCLWTGGGFTMPDKFPVDCENFGSSRQHRKLGGKSLKTKNIRSATPRGFSVAVAQVNPSTHSTTRGWYRYRSI